MPFDLNQSVVSGRVVRDPQFKQLPGGTEACSFTVASNRQIKDDQKRTLYQDVEAYGFNAKYVQRNVSKGSRVMVVGPVDTQQWVDKATQQQRSRNVLSAMTIEILFDERAAAGQQANESAAGQAAPQRRSNPQQPQQTQQAPSADGAPDTSYNDLL